MDSDAANNDKKITWTRQTGNSAGSATSTPAANQAPTDLPIDPVDLSTRFADKTSVAKGTPTSSNDIDALKGEIEAALSRQNVPADDPNQTVVRPRSDRAIDLDAPDSLVDKGVQDSYTPYQAPSLNSEVPKTPAPTADPAPMKAQEDEAALIDSLKGDIKREVSAGQDNTVDKAVPDAGQQAATKDSARGMGQTYYSDLSRAMSSNEPATMSELIRKARFEEKESKILSPKSKKNIAFIAGAVILLVASIGVLGSVFRGEPKVEFITEERVSSLVRSNLDTGINTTGLESARIKGAIREVIEMKIPEDAVNQIYYVEEDGLGNLRRLGLKDIFDKTDSQVPDLLYDNVENTFTHGVFKTDKNYPFLVMKALSYDRAFQGMLDWEETMIDDLAPYLDLPPEATDRSLIKDGFEDDLIRNKIVRVARFLPRDVDRRGILDFLNGNNDDTGTSGESEPLGFLHRIQVALGIAEPALAQDLDWDFGSGDGDNTERVCYNNAFPGQTFGPEFEGQTGYYCVDVISGGGTIGQISSTKPVCFDPVTGDRIDLGGSVNPAWFCFESYQCYRYSCFQGGVEIGPGNEGVPGASCREVTEEGPKFYETDPRYNEAVDGGQKICRQFTGLLNLQNINSALLCFDESGRYLPNYTSPDAAGGITCITPMSRQDTVCVSRAGDIVPPTFPGEKLCFEPLANASTTIDVNSQCGDLTLIEIQQRLMSAAFELRFIAEIGAVFGLSQTDVNNLYQAAAALEELAYTNVLQIDVVRETAFILQQLEVILDTIDPNQELSIIGQNGGLNLYGHLRMIIDTVKCALGIGNTLQWSTLGQIPQGITIYAGQIIPEVEPIQQFLVLVGLMDPVSVTGALDLVTQDAISQLQLANALEVTGIIDPDTLLLIQSIIEGQGSIYGGDAIINDYFVMTGGVLDIDGQILTLGAYNDTVEALQVLLYAEGYDILTINGLFDASTCRAVQAFQADQGLEVSDDFPCTVGDETLEALNQIIRDGGYLGSGFVLNPQGYLVGTGTLEGTYGPGIVDFSLNPADADSLNEGDVVLLYTFLDEETILIARDQVVIDEIIRRRALDDIFN